MQGRCSISVYAVYLGSLLDEQLRGFRLACHRSPRQWGNSLVIVPVHVRALGQSLLQLGQVAVFCGSPKAAKAASQFAARLAAVLLQQGDDLGPTVTHFVDISLDLDDGRNELHDSLNLLAPLGGT